MRVLFCGSGWMPIVDAIAARLSEGSSIRVWDRARPLSSVVEDIDVLLPSNGHIGADVIAAASRLRLIQQPAAGTEGIAVEAARTRGIPVCNAPGTNHVSVAEHALFLLLALARRAPAAARAFAAREVGVPLGIELCCRTLGIIGMGRSGTALAERARALGMVVRALGRTATADERRVFFSSCDAYSIHCPLNDTTRGLVGADACRRTAVGLLVRAAAREEREPDVRRERLERRQARDREGVPLRQSGRDAGRAEIAGDLERRSPDCVPVARKQLDFEQGDAGDGHSPCAHLPEGDQALRPPAPRTDEARGRDRPPVEVDELATPVGVPMVEASAPGHGDAFAAGERGRLAAQGSEVEPPGVMVVVVRPRGIG